MAAMYETFISLMVMLALTYAGLGLLFALFFVVLGVARVDELASGSGFGFRLIILPGVVAFWPLMLLRWVHGTKIPVERTPHR
jgi:hypothetical protein